MVKQASSVEMTLPNSEKRKPNSLKLSKQAATWGTVGY